MSLTEVTNPVQDIGGVKHNCFKGYIPTFFELSRQDIPVSSIVSQSFGGELLIKITTTGSLDASQNIQVGDPIALNTDLYPNMTATIVDIVIVDQTFVVDIAYIGDDNTGFLNYRKNWFVEYRLVDDETPTDAQDEVKNLFDFVFTSQSEVDGTVELDISVANNKNSPSVAVGLNDDMFLFFKIQWRESYLDFLGNWTSPSIDDAMIVFHASDPILQEGGIEIPFQNNIMIADPILTRFWNDESPKINFLRSRLGDVDPATEYFITVKQYNVIKTEIQSNNISIFNVSGVHTVDLSAIVILASTVFITFEADSQIDSGEYEASEYQDDEYNETI